MTDHDNLDKAKIRNILVEQKDKLAEALELAAESASTVVLDQSRVGRISRMDAMQSQAMSQANNRRKKLKIEQIKTTLLRLDKDDFGYCQECDEPIPEARIYYDATVKLCIGCAEKAEA